MARRKVDLKTVFSPTDSIAFLVIIIGLFIALFLDEMAVRLIGICIAVLGGVALFMMVSPRLTEVSMQRPPRPTESPQFVSQTTSDGDQTRQVFDSRAYRETFGATEGGGEIPLDELQIGLFPDLPKHQTGSLTAGFTTLSASNEPYDLEAVDGTTTVRVVGFKSTQGRSAAPKLAIESRTQRSLASSVGTQKAKTAPIPDVVSKSPDQVITGRVTDEVQISEDVVVRPMGGTGVPQKNHTESTLQPTKTDHTQPGHEHNVTEQYDEVGSQRHAEIRVSTFMADDEEMEPSEEPRKEFDYLLNRVLMVIRSATSARTTAFFWFNKDRQQLVLEARISDAEENFTEQRKLPIGNDVVSRIALEGRPEIVTHITPSAELELLPYYSSNAGTLSFVGVPVYFQGNVVGVLCADAVERNAYTDVTVGFFGHFTKLIGGLVLSYTSKYDLQQNSRTLEIVQQFRAAAADGEPSVEGVFDALFDIAIKHFDISTIGVCAYNPTLRLWVIRNARSVIPEYAELIGTPVDLERSVVGECLTQGESIAVSVEGSTIRVTASEPEIDLCQFIALPMRSLQHTHGALFIENHKGTITNQDVTVAEMLADLAGEMIAGLRDGTKAGAGDNQSDVSASLQSNDEPALFTDKVREEVARSGDYGVPLTVCYIKVDSLVGTGVEDKDFVLQSILAQILQRIRSQVREYDLVDLVQPDTVAVALVAYNAHEAQFWTETLRREVANSPIEANGKPWSATISVGVAQLESGDTWETLLANTQRALDSSAKSKNKVTVYS